MEPLTLNENDKKIIGTLPERWLRMDLISQLAVLEVGRVLHQAGHLTGDTGTIRPDRDNALIIASRYGSLATDLEYAVTLADGIEFASPALFGYTLPNIAAAEAAGHYRISGPVYALLDQDPLARARQEARRWQLHLGKAALIVYGELDVVPSSQQAAPTASFHLLPTS